MDLSSAIAVKAGWELKSGILELLQELNDNAGNHILELFLVVLINFLKVLKLISRQYHFLNLFLSIVILGSSSDLHLNLVTRALAREHLLLIQHLEQLVVVSHDVGALTFAIFVVDHTH